MSPQSVNGGTPAQGTVTVTQPAGLDGVTVPLSVDRAGITLPPSVFVPTGATSATFTIGTGVVSVPTLATICGTYGNVTRCAQLTVREARRLAAPPPR